MFTTCGTVKQCVSKHDGIDVLQTEVSQCVCGTVCTVLVLGNTFTVTPMSFTDVSPTDVLPTVRPSLGVELPLSGVLIVRLVFGNVYMPVKIFL